MSQFNRITFDPLFMGGRAELVNGLLNVDSAPGKGTRVQVYIPLTDEAADRLHHAKR